MDLVFIVNFATYLLSLLEMCLALALAYDGAAHQPVALKVLLFMLSG
jgi:hypothetical protein